MSAVLTDDDVDVRLNSQCSLPAFYDDEEPEMSETWAHSSTEAILWFALMAIIDDHGLDATAIPNMYFYYSPLEARKNVGPDLIVVPARITTDGLTSYRLDVTGPMPVFVAEILSESTWNENDLKRKNNLYLELGIDEYLLIDPDHQFVDHRLMLKTRRGDRWIEQPDAGAGVVSKLGCRFTFDADDRLRIVDTRTGRPLPRPEEARMIERREQEKDRTIQQQAAEIARLKALLPPNAGI
jgi:Uma2 family endonuclease